MSSSILLASHRDDGITSTIVASKYFDDANPRLTVPLQTSKVAQYVQENLATPQQSGQAGYFQHQLEIGAYPGARESFDICTDPLQADKATEIRLFSFSRPHMRAFHYSWLSSTLCTWISTPKQQAF
ncbi:unnamed protein product [Phytophthora lilii]|uniref:Unnamed protein product n=1 Tax=Phytophthora lilii TaxID=2077276 RepID=A0A9W6U9N4_9STRA|nr:unnamed protein product [Phytophthora lilii]